MNLSIIVLVNGRKRYFKDFLKSMLDAVRQTSNAAGCELIFISSGNVGIENQLETVSPIPEGFEIRIVIEKSENKSELRNRGIEESAGDIIYFLDDDIAVVPEFLNIILEKFAKFPEAAVIGGPNLTPPGSSPLERAQGHFLGSFFGSTSMKRRYIAEGNDRPAGQNDLILCNLGFRMSTFKKEGLKFDPRLHYNEENHILSFLEQKGYMMFFCPGLMVFHRRRPDILSYMRQVFESGKGRALSIKLSGRNWGIKYHLPVILLLYLILLPAAVIADRRFFALPLVYVFTAVISAAAAVWRNREHSPLAALYVLMLYPVSHMSYGAGMLTGYLKKVNSSENNI